MTDQAARWSEAVVTDVRDAALGIREITLGYGHPVSGPPGSHVDVALPLGARTGTHSYSVVRTAPDARSVTVAVRLSRTGGGGSRYLHSLSAGDRIRATDPLQGFPLTTGRPGYVLLAGGIGITPLLPMYQALRAAGSPVRLVYAGASRDRMAFAAELAAEGQPVELVVGDEGGRVDPKALVAGLPEGHELYVCGPLGLLDAIRGAWRDAGRPAGGLRFESFGSSGRHAAQEFTVEVPRLSLTLTVPAGQSLLDSLEQAGAEMMSDCRRGECGLCEVRVLDCVGVIDHRDVFLSDAERAAGEYLCTCVTRVAAAGGTVPRLVLDLP
jgi:vanillate O-demethylase ferredoxin subunit